MKKISLVFILMIIAFVAILLLMGRIPYCECGFGLWSKVNQQSTSQHLFDAYSLSHVLHGSIFYGALFLILRKLPLRHRFLIAIAIEMTWEITENTPFIIDRYRAATASLDYYGDSMLNSIGDVISTVFGFYVARRLPVWITIMIVIAIELVLLWLIRDNLTLNILMLLYPIEAIKEWQLR